MNTWEQDLERLYEILKDVCLKMQCWLLERFCGKTASRSVANLDTKDAHTPAAMLNLKVKDMQKGTFVGKAADG